MSIVVAKFRQDFEAVRLAISVSPEMRRPVFSEPVATSDRVARLEVPPLPPGIHYYTLETNGLLRRMEPRRLPVVGSSFRFGAGGDQYSFEFVAPYQHIRNQSPDFFIHLGDLHYEDPQKNGYDLSTILSNYDRLQTEQSFRQFSQDVPIYYIFDDHDYGQNDANRTTPSRNNVLRGYRRRVPARLVRSGATDPVYHSFEKGRCVFIITDLRSERSPNTDADNASKSMMGTAQKNWFKDILADPANAGKFFFWVSSVGWLRDETGGDGWRFFQTEQREISNHIKAHCSGRIQIFCADVHVLGYDNGTNCDYAGGGGGALIRMVQAAPLNRASHPSGGKMTNGPYFLVGPGGGGSFPGPHHQWSMTEVEDEGGPTITIRNIGYRLLNGNVQTMFSTSYVATLG